MRNGFLGVMLAAAVAFAEGAPPSRDGGAGARVSVSWGEVISESVTTPTLQVVVNPVLRRGSAIREAVLGELRSVSAEAVRFVPWFPYPKLAVAELMSPDQSHTFWDFSLIDPLVIDFMKAQQGRSVVMNFSTIPAWMFVTPTPKSYPSDPDETAWTYGGAFEPDPLRDPSLKELADYYGRLVSWYTRGFFVDELGQRHESGYNFHFDYWEVLNEVDVEHASRPSDSNLFSLDTARHYTERYDAIVAAVRQVTPATKFVGGAIAYTSKMSPFFAYFLDPMNHAPGIPLDVVSFHFYAKPSPGLSPREYCDAVFAQADGFLDCVGYLETIRRQLAPETKTAANELGIILAGDTKQYGAQKGADVSYAIPAEYWNLAGALYAYLFARLSILGVNYAAESQLVGYPTQYPSVSMVDWNTGKGNARLEVLKLLIRNFGPKTKLVKTDVKMPGEYNPPDALLALGFVSDTGVHKVLLVNKKSKTLDIVLEMNTATVDHIDVETGAKIATDVLARTDQITLQGFAVAVVTLTGH